MSGLSVGDRIELVKPAIERIQLVRYAGASGDFNRIHVEEGFAQAAGYPSVFAHGMLSMGFLGQLLSERFGPQSVQRLKVRFKAITWPGDVVHCRGEVTGIRGEPGARVADLKVWAETRPGTITVEGTATVRLPG
jgi:acyl dehydratase